MPTQPGPLRDVAVFTMFRGPADQLDAWCAHHLGAGSPGLYVVLDRPEPGAPVPDDPRIRVESLSADDVASLYPSTSRNVERRQVDAFRWMARAAAQDGHRFLAFVDSDELLDLREDFADVAARHPEAGAISVPVREMWFAEGDPTDDPFGASIAVRRTESDELTLRRALGWRAQFLRNGLLGHDVGKAVYRLPVTAGELTVHRPKAGAGAWRTEPMPEEAGRLLHFDCGSVATWNAKWASRLSGSTVATGLGAHRLAQQRLFQHDLHRPAAEQRDFFGRFFSLDRAAEDLLTSAGLAERVQLPTLADRSASTATASSTELVELPAGPGRVDFQFALVCDSRFVRPSVATMTSVLSHMGALGRVRFVVLGDGLGHDDARRLRALEDTEFDVEVVVHDITADLDRDVGTEDPKRATFGRIYLIDYLPPQRTVYLDGDVLATRPFPELFESDFGGASLVGVPDSAALRILAEPEGVPTLQRNRLMGITDGDPTQYLNGGVLVFDLEQPEFRELALRARALVVGQGRALTQRDQDALNLAFAGHKHLLGSEYNYMTQFFVSERTVAGDLTQRKYDAADATLVHFSGRIKPWEAPDDEFYNGLYRRLVQDAEQRVGVSCELYFSAPPKRDWSRRLWAQALHEPADRPPPLDQSAGIAVVDVCDTGVHLRLSADMHTLALARDLVLEVRVAEDPVAEAPMSDLSAPLTRLVERVGSGTRFLPVDLAAALAPHQGVGRDVELVLRRPDGGMPRSLARFDVVAVGPAARPALLDDLGVDGSLDGLEDGWLTGWVRGTGRRPAVVSLLIDGEVEAVRAAHLPRPQQPGARGFRFNVAHLLRLRGVGSGEVSVRVAGTNVPLRGGPLSAADVAAALRRDAPRRTTAAVARARRAARRLVR